MQHNISLQAWINGHQNPGNFVRLAKWERMLRFGMSDDDQAERTASQDCSGTDSSSLDTDGLDVVVVHYCEEQDKKKRPGIG